MYAELEQIKKECKQCFLTKPVEMFRLRRDRKWKNLESYCKQCERENFKVWYAGNKVHQRKRDFVRNCRRFGLTVEQYQSMVDGQNGLCAICKSPETCKRGGYVKNLAIDHCHKTGRIRKLLCNACNTSIGLMKEDPDIFMAAVRYLKEAQELGDKKPLG